MLNKREYHIIIGSKAFFDDSLPSYNDEYSVNNFLG